MVRVDWHSFFGFHRRMQSVLIVSVGPGSSGVPVHQHHLVVVHHVFDPTAQQEVSPQQLMHLVDQVGPPNGPARVPAGVRIDSVSGIEVTKASLEEGYALRQQAQAASLGIHRAEQAFLNPRVGPAGAVGIHQGQCTLTQAGMGSGQPARRFVVGLGQHHPGQQHCRLVIGLATCDTLVQLVPAFFRQPGLLRHKFPHRTVGPYDRPPAEDRRAGDDQGGDSLIQQRLVGFVDDGDVQRPLDLLVRGHDQPIPQVVESELAQRAVDYPVAVGHAALRSGHVVQHCSHGEAQRPVHRRQQLAVPGGQVVVGGDDVNGATHQTIQNRREGGGHGLPLASSHLHDSTTVQVEASQQLLIGGPKVQSVGVAIPPAAGRTVKLCRKEQIAPRVTTPAGGGQLAAGVYDARLFVAIRQIEDFP